MIRRPPRSTRTDTLFPYTTLFRAPVGHPPHVVQQRAGARRQVEQPGAAVSRVGTPFDQFGFGQPIDHARQGDRFALDQLGERTLPYPFLALQLAYQPPLISEESRVGKEGCSTFRSRWSRFELTTEN